jgi:hypothetical protein
MVLIEYSRSLLVRIAGIVITAVVGSILAGLSGDLIIGYATGALGSVAACRLAVLVGAGDRHDR